MMAELVFVILCMVLIASDKIYTTIAALSFLSIYNVLLWHYCVILVHDEWAISCWVWHAPLSDGEV